MYFFLIINFWLVVDISLEKFIDVGTVVRVDDEHRMIYVWNDNKYETGNDHDDHQYDSNHQEGGVLKIWKGTHCDGMLHHFAVCSIDTWAQSHCPPRLNSFVF